MYTRTIPRVALLTSLILSAACSSITRNPLPAEGHLEATFLGAHNMRYWGDDKPPIDEQLLADDHLEEREQLFPGIMHKQHHYLAISGGGSNGAYGAGLLVGWTDAETRPEFTMVTGVSTGALIAPFAYLGPEYDEQLKEVYTTLDTEKIFRLRNIFDILGGDAVGDTSPLSITIEKYITNELIADIAEESRRGRILQIGTTNLDAGRPVVWNIGRIANSGHPDAPDLIRKILRASASIPGAFPPVYIPVRGVDGKMYDEMHVDGGTSSQMFLYPTATDWPALMEALDAKGEPVAYLIRNSMVSPEYEPIEAKLIPIVGKTIDSLIRTQGIGDVYRIYTIAERDGIDVKLTFIPDDAVTVESTETFDPKYMKALFDYGYQRALSGGAWIDVSDAMEDATHETRH